MKILKIIILILVLIWLIWFLKFAKHYPHTGELKSDPQIWGVTYSTKFAEELGLDWQETYLAIIDDLQVKQIRLPIYWDQIEKYEGEFDFVKYDYILDEGSKRDVQFIVNIGWRLPRWPECHAPRWLAGREVETIKARTLSMLKIVMDHYKHRSEIIAWQVENEPLVDWFGICPKSDRDFLHKEINLVKSLDDRPIIISASGELSLWSKEAEEADILATTVYRVVWNSWFKYFRYPVPAWFYKYKARRVQKFGDNMIISELQAEPWVPNGTLADLSPGNQSMSFDLEQLEANLKFAQKIGFSKNYLWGAEWWYWKKIIGDDSYWNLAKTLFVK